MHILVRRKGAVCTDDERKVKEKIKDLLEKITDTEKIKRIYQIIKRIYQQ
jgi:predicted transcriptional regulator